MAKRLNEYDYLYISARIHTLETKLLTRERMERMLSARTAGEAARVLSECGFGDFPALTPAGIEEGLNRARLALFDELRRDAPDPNLVDVFRVKYDYHNAKALLKAEAVGRDDTEKAAILNYLLPKMLTAGFVTVTIASVILAGAAVNLL